MTEPFTGLAAGWTQRLLKLLGTIRTTRQEELTYISNVFGDPEVLAKFYVEPDCQNINPADLDEDEAERALRQPIHDWLNGFLKGEFFERDGRNTVFVLSDAGMGKTSLLMMLKLTHLLRFWPNGLDFRLMKLGEETLGALRETKNHSRTVLLLDGLDEDTTAWQRLEERLIELLHATKSYRQVILTCRTQFFPKGGDAPIEKSLKIEVGGFICNLLYLSPFSDAQVEAYLRKVYPNKWTDLFRKWVTAEQDNPKLTRARQLIKPMRSLRMRPMLLARIDELMDAGVKDWGEYAVYKALVEHWLLREERKQEGRLTKAQLWEASTAVALHLQTEGKRVLSPTDLEALVELQPAAQQITEFDVGGRSLLNRASDGSFRFSHYSIQEFLVAHRLVAEVPGPLRATDQLLAFLLEWLAGATPEQRKKFSWGALNLGGADLREAKKLTQSQIDAAIGDENTRLPKGLTRPRSWTLWSGVEEWNRWRKENPEVDPNLRGTNLRGADLHGADLHGADLHGANLHGADLHGANLRAMDLRGVDLRLAKNLAQSQIAAAIGDERTLLPEGLTRPQSWILRTGVEQWNRWRKENPEATPNLSGAYLGGADLGGADLSGANLRRADLGRAKNLTQSQIAAAIGDEKTLLPEGLTRPQSWILRTGVEQWNRWRKENSKVKPNLRGVNLGGADLRGANLSLANLFEADLRGTNLQGADLRGVGLRGVVLGRTDLHGANLSWVDLRRVDLRLAKNLTQSQMDAAIGDEKTLLPEGLTRPQSWILRTGVEQWNRWRKENPEATPNLSGAYLGGADLGGADLSGANLRRADLRGAKNLTQSQIAAAIGDEKTLLPEGLTRPQSWFLRTGVEQWNRWRKENSKVQPNLRGANLGGADLRGANLCLTNLFEADLRGTNLQGADLRGAVLRGVVLGRTDLHGANLSWVDLRRVDLRLAKNLTQSQMDAAIGDEKTLLPEGLTRPQSWILWTGVEQWNRWRKENPEVEPNLRGAYFGGADLGGANLGGANLGGADLRLAKNLTQSQIAATIGNEKTLLPEGLKWPQSWLNLKGVDVREVDLRGMNLREVDLRGVDLRGVDLREADLREVDLGQAHLGGVDLRGVDLRGVKNLTQSQVHGAIGDGKTLLPGGLTRPQSWRLWAGVEEWNRWRKESSEVPHLGGAYLGGADLSGADLGGAYLVRAYLVRADLRGAKNLTQSQIDATIGDRKTLLPEGLKRPQSWLLWTSVEEWNRWRKESPEVEPNLRGADLRGVDLRGADLRGADLRGVDLRGADLRGADLRGAKNLTQPQIHAAHRNEHTLLPWS